MLLAINQDFLENKRNTCKCAHPTESLLGHLMENKNFVSKNAKMVICQIIKSECIEQT